MSIFKQMGNRKFMYGVMILILFYACGTNKVESYNLDKIDKESYSNYTFNILDFISNSPREIKVDFFGEITTCEYFDGAYHIKQDFIDSVTVDFENDLVFRGRPILVNDDGSLVKMMVRGFIKDDHFDLVLVKEEKNDGSIEMDRDSVLLRVNEIMDTINHSLKKGG